MEDIFEGLGSSKLLPEITRKGPISQKVKNVLLLVLAKRACRVAGYASVRKSFSHQNAVVEA